MHSSQRDGDRQESAREEMRGEGLLTLMAKDLIILKRERKNGEMNSMELDSLFLFLVLSLSHTHTLLLI